MNFQKKFEDSRTEIEHGAFQVNFYIKFFIFDGNNTQGVEFIVQWNSD